MRPRAHRAPMQDQATPDVDDAEAAEGTPVWVKVSAVIALVLLLVVAALHLTGNSPGGHTP